MDKQNHSHNRLFPAPTQMTRRTVVGWTAKLAAGTLAATIPAGGLVQTALADNGDVVILTAASGAQVSARPGSATARSAAAEAAAARGAARVQTAAALAEAKSDGGAIAQGAAAAAAADPDQGAIAQSASAVTSVSSQDDVAEKPQAAPPAVPRTVAPAPRGGGRRARGGGARRVRVGAERIRGGRRTAHAGVDGERVRRRDRPGSLPSAGIGQLERNSLPSLFTFASAVAALGAVVLRDRGATAQPAEVVVSGD